MCIVVGLGVSGIAAVELLLHQGLSVWGWDDRSVSSYPDQMALIQSIEQIHWPAIQRVILSPGVALSHPICHLAIQNGIEVIGEAELALRCINLKNKPKMIGVTGTNGKTTVTLLIAHILNTAGLKAVAVGNVGYPLCRYVKDDCEHDADVLIIELSSYQLETLSTSVFDGAVILNITPDHLDRYPSMEGYAKAKCHLQHLLYTNNLKNRECGEEAPFFVHRQVIEGFSCYLESSYLEYGKEDIVSFLPLQYHEWEGFEIDNMAAAWAICSLFYISKESFFKGVDSFQKPLHRIEFVDVIDGVFFFDDSKGTNVDAVIYAVQAMKGPVILIVGGVNKGASYGPWKEAFQGKVKRMIAIGMAADKMIQELHPYFEIEGVTSLKGAVQTAFDYAIKGDYILLSPGCASYDMFRDYAHRGEEFQKQVHYLREGRRSR